MIIGILGRAGSGKTTMADYLARNKKYVVVNLADPLKRIAKEVYGFSDMQLWGASEHRNSPDKRYPRADGTFLTPREALQRLGTEWGRTCYEDTWVEYAMRTASRVLHGEAYDPVEEFSSTWWNKVFKKKCSGVAIPDVRFQNEVDSVKEGGGVIVKLESDWAPQLSAGVEGHASEKLDIRPETIDHILNVPKGLPNFYREIDSLLLRL